MEVFGNIFEEKRHLEIEMATIQLEATEGGPNEDTINIEEKLSLEMEKRDKQEEVLWQKKSRVQWLKEGDQNSKFFHNYLLQHCSQNRITSLVRDYESIMWIPLKTLKNELVIHFHHLLKEPEGDREEVIQKVTRSIPR
jgi:hypothetical protein